MQKLLKKLEVQRQGLLAKLSQLGKAKQVRLEMMIFLLEEQQ